MPHLDTITMIVLCMAAGFVWDLLKDCRNHLKRIADAVAPETSAAKPVTIKTAAR